MHSVEEARRICAQQVALLPAEFLRLEQAVGACLAEDAFALDDHPRMDVSAVDGYAVGDADGPWRIEGSIAAGAVMEGELSAGRCARVFTGAALPVGCFAVVMQEHVRAEGDLIVHQRGALAPMTNIRRQGEAHRVGELLMAKGLRITAAGVGLLASGGIDEVMVTLEPHVCVVRTGDEFIGPDRQGPGLIHSSNERLLVASLREAWFSAEEPPFTAGDTVDEIRSALEQALAAGDAVITTGGVSVGDHDHVRLALEGMGAVIHFHGVAQKPGKPMLFASVNGRPVFGLPGNPRAVLVCWHAYVKPFLRAMQGDSSAWNALPRASLAHAVRLKGERAEFRAAQTRDGRLHLLPDEGSHMLATLVHADALACFPAAMTSAEAGDLITFIPLRAA
jgi:molybdopterin molybdotransferase